MRYSVIKDGKVVNHAEADEEFAASQGWIPAGKSRIGDTWDGQNYSAPVITLDEKKAALKTRLAELATAKLSGGTVINGLKVSTHADAKGMFALGKIGNKVSRKVVTSSGQRAILTAAQFDALVAGVDNFGQDIMNRHYDLIGQIDAASESEFDTIDINVGWPT